MSELIDIIPDDGHHDDQVDRLYAQAFGPGRFAKAAARLREGNVCKRELSVLALQGRALCGVCRLWPIVADNGVAAFFLGPIAVDQSMRSIGLGKQLVDACLAAVDASTRQTVILVGDYSYFGKLGFDIVPAGQVIMPGPVDPKRLLWRVGDPQLPEPIGSLSVPRATTLAS